MRYILPSPTPFFSLPALASTLLAAVIPLWLVACANAERIESEEPDQPDARRVVTTFDAGHDGGTGSGYADNVVDDTGLIPADAGGDVSSADDVDINPDAAGGNDAPGSGDAGFTTDTGTPTDAGSTDALPTPTCTSDGECELGFGCFRVLSDSPGTCLAACASDDDCGASEDCVLLTSSGTDAARFCVDRLDTGCRPCNTSVQCGGGICTSLADGEFCAMPCDGDRDCESGFVCQPAGDGVVSTDVCVPATGFCSACLDLDGDLHGQGDCLGTDCNDRVATIFSGAPELCDGVDNDCDGTVDEGFDLSNDPRHCGACGAICPSSAADGTPFVCAMATCVLDACPSGRADRNGLSADGCEAGINLCGGYASLSAVPGTRCDACGGEWTCNGPDRVVCTPDPLAPVNACGGCTTLARELGTACGRLDRGELVCDGNEALRCSNVPIVMIVGNAVEFHPTLWQMHSGRTIADVMAGGTLVARLMGAPSTFHNAEVPVTQTASDGWIRLPMPALTAGLAPYREHSTCRGTGIEGLPFRFTLRDRSLPESDVQSWLFIDMNDLLDDLGFIGLGDDGTESYTLALSNLDGSLVATGRRLSGPAPDACARDNGP